MLTKFYLRFWKCSFSYIDPVIIICICLFIYACMRECIHWRVCSFVIEPLPGTWRYRYNYMALRYTSSNGDLLASRPRTLQVIYLHFDGALFCFFRFAFDFLSLFLFFSPASTPLPLPPCCRRSFHDYWTSQWCTDIYTCELRFTLHRILRSTNQDTYRVYKKHWLFILDG